MSSQQWLYPIFRFQGYRVTKVETEERMLLLHIEPQPHRVCCPQCHSREVIRRGEQVRWFRNVPVGSDGTWLIATLPRVECRACGIVRQISLGLAEPRRTYTHAFARYVLELSRYMIIKDVARHLGVSWDIVKDIQKQYLQRHYAKPNLKKVRQIAIDENCLNLLKASVNKLRLSARAHDKILRVSRTIADLDQSDEIRAIHLNEAINYRMLDRQMWT